MAPFLVITLLLALGAGIVAWCVTGPAYQGPPLITPRKDRRARRKGAASIAPPAPEPVISALEPSPVETGSPAGETRP
jgi:hypothetical protein